MSSKDKTCSICQVIKPTSAFNKMSAAKDGLRPHCKECRKSITAKHRASRRGVLSAKQRDYYHETVVTGYYTVYLKRFKGKPIYVGQTRTTLDQRLRGHRGDSKAGATWPMAVHIRANKRSDYTIEPICKIFGTKSDKTALAVERAMIKEYKTSVKEGGCNVTEDSTDGI